MSGTVLTAAHGIAPACPVCGSDLAVDQRRQLLCTDRACTRPSAAAELLSEGETEHIVTLSEDGYSVKHPIRERLDDELLDCWLADQVAAHGQEWVVGIPLDREHRVEIGTPYRMWVEDGDSLDPYVEWQAL